MKTAFAFFCSVISIMGGIIYSLLRVGFPTDHSSVFKAVGLCLILLISPLFVEEKLSEESKEKWYYNSSFQLLILLSACCLIGFFFKEYTFDYAIFLAGIGYAFFGWLIVEIFKTTPIIKMALFFLSSIIFSLYVVYMAFSIHIEPLFFEDLFSGAFHWNVDTLYHVANAQIYNTYGILSTGLDGVNYIPYHYGSHVLYAELSNFLKIKILDSYIILPFAITWPVFTHTFLSLVYQIRKHNGLPEKVGYTFVIVLLTAFIGFMRNSNYGFYKEAADYVGMLLGSPILFLSDSYTVSLVFLNIIFILILNFCSNYKQGSQNKLNVIAFLWIVLPIIFVFAGFSKISTLYMAFLVFSFLFVRLGLYSNKLFTISYLLIVIVSIVVFYLIRDEKYGDGGLSLFYHFNQTASNLYLFLLLGFIWTWALLLLLIYFKIIKSIREIGERKFILLEIPFVMLISSLVPAFLLEVRGGQLYYFTEIAAWYSAALILSYIPLFSFHHYKNSAWNAKIKILCTVLIIIYLINVYYSNVESYFNWMRRANYSTRYYMLKGPVGLATPDHFKIAMLYYFDTESFYAIKNPLLSVHLDTARVIPAMNFIDKLSSLNELPLFEKKMSAVYINFSTISFQIPVRCYELAFLVPALSGMASIHGGITNQCLQENPWFNGYSFENYGILEPTRADNISALKIAAVKSGFRWLYYYDNQKQEFVKLNCISG